MVSCYPSFVPGSYEQRGAAYAFGDSKLAARRLELVAKVFAPTSRAFIAESVGFRPRLAIDLGSGPGYTTRLIANTLAPAATVGIEISPAFLSAARAGTPNSNVSFVRHDVTRMPLPPGEPDLMFARFLLSHLPQPEAAVTGWMTQLRPGGLLLLEEVEWIRTENPAFSTYLEIVVAMLADRGQDLYVGPRLDAICERDGWTRRLSRVARLAPTTGQAARMFSMNLPNWREDPFVRANYPKEEIARLQGELSELCGSRNEGEIFWGLRQIAIEAQNQASL